MWHHFWDIIQARDAVIGARLKDVGPPLTRIASGEFGMDMPPDWMKWVEQMQEKAKQGAQAESLQAAALAVSTVAAECADCHRTTGGGPKLEGDTRGYKPEGTGLAEAMARHAWAAEELWLGMTAPRHEAWMRGATALASMKLPQDEPPPPAEGEAEAAAPEPAASAAPAADASSPLWQKLEEMRALGKRAEQAAQPAEKTAIYAEMIAHCASCHQQAGFE
jgi:mono/diheme cytochrome c family protein